MPNNKWYRTILLGNSKFLELTEASVKIACKRWKTPGRECNKCKASPLLELRSRSDGIASNKKPWAIEFSH